MTSCSSDSESVAVTLFLKNVLIVWINIRYPLLLMSNEPSHTNRLIEEKSPFLQQHAHNPVDWRPWGDEAFQAARDADKPIFLSIGYATCHWCHVMEQESFEDPQIAQMLNETFINVMVDREELPEVDGLYMEFAQSMMAGAAGWPLNVILTPSLEPFFASTYLPPVSSHGLIGMNDLIARIREVWQGEEREQVQEQAAQIVEVFRQTVQPVGDEIPVKELVEDAADLLFKLADPVHGGMRGKPKFPVGYQVNFMLRYMGSTNDSRAVFLVDKTLDMMHRGGIYDHLGGGFARYSVDEEWIVPHFEKMLYDNALLVGGYLEAWQAAGKPLYKEVCEEVIAYILRDMTHPAGGFYSAEDADSDGGEGRFYTWTVEEIDKILGKSDAGDFRTFFEITQQGNFEGRNVLHTPYTVEEFAQIKGEKDPGVIAEKIEKQKQMLFKAREKRPHPFKDDKVLSSWNGLMIASLAEAGAAFAEQSYIDAAKKAAYFIHEHMWKDGQLYRRWRENQAMFNAGLDEYAFLIKGLLHLFETGAKGPWLPWAIEMSRILERLFKAEGGAFYQTDGEDPNIIMRKCQFSDGAEPSGNAVHCENLLRLFQITQSPHYMEQAEDILKAVRDYIQTYPPGYCYHVMNVNRYYDASAPSLVIALNDEESLFEELRKLVFARFIPHKAVIWRKNNDKKLFDTVPWVESYEPRGGKTTLYICYQGACQEPLNDFDSIKQAIESL